MSTDVCCPHCDSVNCDIAQGESSYVCAECGFTWDTEDESEDGSFYDDSMDGDAESALASAGLGTEEDYGGGSDIDTDYGDDY